MRTFMKLFAAGLMLTTATTAFAIGNPMIKTGHAYMTPGGNTYVARAPMPVARAPATTTDTTVRRSLSVEPGTAPAAVVAPTYRVVRRHTSTWLLPKTDAHRYTTW